MRQTVTALLAGALVLVLALFPATTNAQPTIDGDRSGDADYEFLAAWNQNDTGFGDHGILELSAFENGSDLYLNIIGEAENNGNCILLFVNLASQDGVDAGTAIPPGTDNLSPFNDYSGTIHDFETDFGFRLCATNDNGTSTPTPAAFVSAIDYRSLGSATNAPEEFLPGPNSNSTIPGDGTSYTFTGTTSYDGIVMAYDDTDLLSNVTTTGWEFSVPLSILGATGSETYELFALYTSGSGDFVSANTLPEIAGQSGTNLGGNPDFTSIADDQHTGANPLPVELADFRAMPDGSSAVLTWRTLSETSNDRFEIEHAAPGQTFRLAGTMRGQGTTVEATDYQFRLDDLAPGTHRFRLRQVDVDGTASLSRPRSATIGVQGISLSKAAPHPVAGRSTFGVSVDRPSPVRVEMFNLLGQRVRTLFDGTVTPAQSARIEMATGGLAAGTYFIRATNGTASTVQRVTVVR